MKHLSILVPLGENNLSSIVGSYKLLSRANELWQQRGKLPVFKIELVGAAKRIHFYGDFFSVKPQRMFWELKHTDLIIIPSLNHNYVQSVSLNKEVVSWLQQQHRRGAEIASICTGAFLLAATGLVDGKKCSTHWSAAAELQRIHPKVEVTADKIITDECGIYTNGGAYSFLNLLLYLIEKFYDRKIALQCAKIFEIEYARESQSEFMIFNGQKAHEDATVLKAQNYIEKNYTEKINMEMVAEKYHVSRRTFDRRFIKATGITPLDYLQHVKMEAAKRALENSKKTVSEVMYQVGYSDAKAFRETFAKYTGITPLSYKTKYNKRLD